MLEVIPNNRKVKTLTNIYNNFKAIEAIKIMFLSKENIKHYKYKS